MSSSEEVSPFLLVADVELQQYLYAIVSAWTVGPLNTADLKLFMANHFEKSNKSAAPPTMARCQDTLEYMRNTLEAVDFFVDFCIDIFAKAHGAPPRYPHSSFQPSYGRPAAMQTQPPPSRLPLSIWRDKRPIRRALVRFQLYCELFHQPGDASESVSDWEERLQEQEAFWLHYEWWEVEEVKCIYQAIVFCLENTSIGETSQSGKVLPDAIQERGLTQLRHFFDESIARPTTFGEGYLRRFLARSFRGFRQADPDDYSYFSTPRPAGLGELVSPGRPFKGTGIYRTLFSD